MLGLGLGLMIFQVFHHRNHPRNHKLGCGNVASPYFSVFYYLSQMIIHKIARKNDRRRNNVKAPFDAEFHALHAYLSLSELHCIVYVPRYIGYLFFPLNFLKRYRSKQSKLYDIARREICV